MLDLCYLDDLLVISEDFERHLKDLQKVFDRLCQFSLRANRNKICCFGREEVKYLDHLITPAESMNQMKQRLQLSCQ